jgi:transcriptional regulator with XRE-family HTH domain
MSSPAERFGLLLARQRMRAALAQEDLSRLVGMHRTEVALLERGRRRARLDTVLRLAAGVECEPSELLSGMRWIPGVAEIRGGYLAPPRPGRHPLTREGRRSAGDPAPLLRRFGSNLRARREALGWTPEELAARAGIGVKLLVELEEAGGTIPALRLFLHLVGALGCRPSELVAGVEWVPYRTFEGEGTFEVLEDAGLLDEIAALREARPRCRSSSQG